MISNRFVQVFFREERLPIAEGWKRSPVPIANAALGALDQQIANASDWTADAGQDPSVTFLGNTTI